jgi:hypothetical protein
MRVKKTKTGKFSIELEHGTRTFVFGVIIDFLQDESATIKSGAINSEPHLMRHLYCAVLNEMVTRKNFFPHLCSPSKILLERSQALALTWLLRTYDHDMILLQLKSNLHKQLHA